MIIMASHDLASPLEVFEATVLEDIMSIFITSAVLRLIQGVMLFFTSIISHKGDKNCKQKCLK